MWNLSRPLILRYGVAVFTVGLALVITLQVGFLANHMSFALFYAAVMVSTWYGGRGPGLLAIALSALAGDFFLIAPLYALMANWDNVSLVVTFGLVALLINSLMAASVRSQRMLLESEGRFRNEAMTAERNRSQLEAVIQAVADGIMVSDMAGNFVLVNEAEARIKGYSSSEEMKRNIEYFAEIYELIYPDGRPLPVEDWPLSKVLRGESFFEWELHGRRRDTGQEWFFSFSGEPVRDERGEPVLAVIVTRDITRHKRAEEEINELGHRNELILKSAGEGIYGLEPDGATIFINPAAEGMTGWAPGELSGKLLHETLHHTRPDGTPYPAEECPVFQTLKDGKARRIVDEVFWRKDGTSFPVEYTSTPVLEGDRLVGAVVTFSDVTERKRLEEQLRQSQKLESVGLLAGGVAHDFNNLLTVIIGYSDLTRHQLGENDPLRQNINEIRKAAERASGLTRQLLAFSRKQLLQPKVLDLTSTVAEMDKMLQRLIGEDVHLATILDPQLKKVKADPGQIEQVLMNLAVNARDAMPGGGKLTIETKNVYLDEAYARGHATVTPGLYVMLAVSDTGHGMDAQTMEHIFEPFFTTKEQGKGTGLGLSTVFGIVKQSGGNIWVYSEPGHGTTFKVYFPAIAEEGDSIEPDVATPEVPRGTETILVVEDEEAVRFLLQAILEDEGYKVLAATSGVGALNVCKEHEGPIHLVMTDVVMPEMSGRQLVERLTGRCGDAKVLYMSGYTDNAIVHHRVLEPGVEFLQKPFTPDAVVRKVRDVLDGV
jgi:two-component system cell cycle sensor histidine kinase/response regulator CckA